ncbi:MAG: DUF2764 family protein [Chlamydiota bacterium]
MAEYYYLTSLLPPLTIGDRPGIPFSQFCWLLKVNLSPADYHQTVVIRRFNDIQNLRALWKKGNFDNHGNYTLKELKDILTAEEALPNYVFDFLKKYNSLEERLQFFPELISTFFAKEIEQASGFLKHYLQFVHDLRLVMVGFRAKKLGRNLEQELQFEDPYDEIVAQIMAQRDSKNYEPPRRFEGLKPIFEENYEKPLELHKKLCQYRFEWLEFLREDQLFSMNKILTHLVQLEMVEKWIELDQQEGKKVVNNIIKALA